MTDHRITVRSISWLLCLLGAAFWVYTFAPPSGANGTEASYDELLTAVRTGRVEAVDFSEKSITATLKHDKSEEQPKTLLVGRLPSNSDTELIQALEASRVKFSGHADFG